jgi:glycosyltransferase involved in cell wall biosynthesis
MKFADTTILFIDHTSELGGAERSMLDLLSQLDRSCFTPIVATSAGPLCDRLKAMGIEVWPLHLEARTLTLSREDWRKSPWLFLWRARGIFQEIVRLARLARARPINFIHTNTLKAHVLGTFIAKLAGKPLIWHMRDLPSSRGDARPLLSLLFRFARPGIIAISQAVADDLPALMHARTRVVHNGIDLALFDQRAAQLAENLPLPVGNGPLIGTLSHLIPWKGQDVFLRAAARLADRHPDWRFLIVGDAIFQFQGERGRLQALAVTLGIADRVAFAGHREDAPALLKQLDLFVLPSLYEPFGRVLIEAMGAELPVVASMAGGVPEIVSPDETGVLVEPGNAEALASAIEETLLDRERARQMGLAGRKRVEACFSLQATLTQVVAAYGALL